MPSRAEQEVAEAAPFVTPERLRASLMEMGMPPTAQNLALAEAFSRLGLALTREALAEANTALARAPGGTARAYALARAWGLPTTPAALNALAAATGDAAVPPEQALSTELLSYLGLAADAGMETEALTAHLYLIAQGTGQSTEHRLLTEGGPVQDVRSILLRLAQGSADRGIQRGADALAAHIEGQQLINQVTRPGTDPGEFYLAVPILFGQEPALAEMRLGCWDDDQETEDLPEETPWLRATVRVTVPRLGRIQAALMGTLAGVLHCRLHAEKPATARLLHSHSDLLSKALASTGDWRIGTIDCRVQTEWIPLWHGGTALAAPRACIDWRA